MRRRLLEMGLTPGTRVMVQKMAPSGDADRDSYPWIPADAFEKKTPPKFRLMRFAGAPAISLPADSEAAHEHISCTGRKTRVAGKRPLFNQLTGSNQHVGNFPGVTVEHKEGKIKGEKDMSVVRPARYLFAFSLYSRKKSLRGILSVQQNPDAIFKYRRRH